MEEYFSKFTQKGLPGGPNELKAFTEGFVVSSEGQWAYPGMNTLIPNADGRITMQGVNYPVLGIDDLGNEMMMQPGEEYQFPGDSVYEIPMKKGGLVKMPKLTKKNKKAYDKKFSRSIDATSRLFTESPLFAKPKSKKRKIFDPKSQYQDGGMTDQEKLDAARGMMKARLAYAHMHGNPAAQRMVVAPDQPYEFENGDTGTHFMASMGDYAVPLIQNVNGQLMLGDFGHDSKEAIKFDNPEDAMYFADHYKEVSPAFEEAELTDEEIEEYRRGGWIVEELDTYPRGGGLGKGKDKDKKSTSSTKFKPKGDVAPFVTSNPEEYAYRKAAYDDSLHVANKYNSIMPKPMSSLPYYRDGTVSQWRKPTIKNHYVIGAHNTMSGDLKGMESPVWKNYERATNYERSTIDYPNLFNEPVAYEVKSHYFPKRAGRTLDFGFFKIQQPDSYEFDVFRDLKPRYQPPRQKIIFQEPPKPSKPTVKKPKVIQQKPVVNPEVIQPTPIPEPIPAPTPVIVNPELQKFVEERKPEPPGPPPGPGTDVMPVYDIDELPMYATPDPDAEWVGKTERYIDWDGTVVKYKVPRFKKMGHSGPLIKGIKTNYFHLPSIESRYQAEIVPEEEEYDNGGGVNFQTYEEQLRQLENSIKAGYRGGKWYPHDSVEKGRQTIGYGHKLSGNENYSQGLTTAQVLALQKKDLVKHKNIAKSTVDKKYGAGTFDGLPESRKVLLVDYAYNGVLGQFPKFMEAVIKGDKTGMLKEYKRYTGNKPLTQRNEWTRSVIEGTKVGTAKTNTPKTLPAKTAPKKQPVKQPVKKPVAQPKFSSNETFSYDYRPDAVYRVADSGDWYINAGKKTNNEFIKLNDPTGKRTEVLKKFAHINEVPLDMILERINNSGNYDLRQDLGYLPGQ